MRMTKPLATAITGGLGAPSKMPGSAWGIPASTCQVGGLLKLQDGTQCAICYAERGRYRFQNVQNRLWASLELFNIAAESPRGCLLYTSPSPRDRQKSRMPSSA